MQQLVLRRGSASRGPKRSVIKAMLQTSLCSWSRLLGLKNFIINFRRSRCRSCRISITTVCFSQGLPTSSRRRKTSPSTFPRMHSSPAKQRRTRATWPTPGSGRRTTSTSRSKVMTKFTSALRLLRLSEELTAAPVAYLLRITFRQAAHKQSWYQW